jgi:molybdopterin-binding protein
MPISARNKLRGKIEEIHLGDVMAHIVVRVGDNLIESVITRRSADELKLKKGDTVSVVVKATEVMIQTDWFSSLNDHNLQGRHLPDPSGHSFFVRDHDSVCPFFLTERFPLPQESQQGLLIGECRVQLWQRYDSPIAISRLHEQTVREALALIDSPKATPAQFAWSLPGKANARKTDKRYSPQQELSLDRSCSCASAHYKHFAFWSSIESADCRSGARRLFVPS